MVRRTVDLNIITTTVGGIGIPIDMRSDRPSERNRVVDSGERSDGVSSEPLVSL